MDAKGKKKFCRRKNKRQTEKKINFIFFSQNGNGKKEKQSHKMGHEPRALKRAGRISISGACVREKDMEGPTPRGKTILPTQACCTLLLVPPPFFSSFSLLSRSLPLELPLPCERRLSARRRRISKEEKRRETHHHYDSDHYHHHERKLICPAASAADKPGTLTPPPPPVVLSLLQLL